MFDNLTTHDILVYCGIAVTVCVVLWILVRLCTSSNSSFVGDVVDDVCDVVSLIDLDD